MTEYVLSPAAENDLWQIWRFIAQDKPTAASKVMLAAYETFDLLASSPLLGKRRTLLESPKLDVRSCPVSGFVRYVIFYQPQENSVRMLCVYHCRGILINCLAHFDMFAEN